MPRKYIIKVYKPNAYYHIYNRGVEKRAIFLTPEDYKKFLHFLKESITRTEVCMVSYCLMHNHYHLLVYQQNPRDITKLMRSVGTKYSSNFNYKYDRVGCLFQSSYRARIIKSEEDLLATSAYIHNNPYRDKPGSIPKKYQYTSLPEYLGTRTTTWVNTQNIISIFKQHNSVFWINDYLKYHEDKRKERMDLG